MARRTATATRRTSTRRTSKGSVWGRSLLLRYGTVWGSYVFALGGWGWLIFVIHIGNTARLSICAVIMGSLLALVGWSVRGPRR